MIDWTQSMQQTFEFYIVDPDTWKDVKLLETVKTCSIDYDDEAGSLGSSTMDIAESIGECYIRTYLITVQNGVTEKRPIGTFLYQTQPSDFDGKCETMTLEGYTSLLELKEDYPPIGYFVPEHANIMNEAYNAVNEHTRAPVVRATSEDEVNSNFIADPADNWLSFITSLIANAKYVFRLDEMGRILFAPKQDLEALQSVWTYDDDNSSILYPDLKKEYDLYGIPNTVEVICSKPNGETIRVIAINEDPDSPTSTIARGRTIKYRDTDPNIIGTANEKRIEEYAITLLKELSSVERTVTYKHGYCPARVGDCVRLNYKRAGLENIKAKVISQSIECIPGCPVSEKAVYTTKLCRGEYIRVIK